MEGELKRVMSLEDALQTHPDPEARRLLEEELEKRQVLSITDPLTNLFNFRGFDSALNKAVRLSKRHDLPFSIAFADIYGLKYYNNDHNFETGNQAIKQFGLALLYSAREEDTVARIGGDEFGLILPGVEEKDHLAYLNRMKLTIYSSPKIVEEIPFIGYWGVAQYHGQEIRELKDEAYEKLNKEKEIIKNALNNQRDNN